MTEAAPSVAILVPVLNETDFVDKVVTGLQAQTYPGPMTFYVVDGGSADDTVARFTRAAQDDPRFVLLHNPRRVTPAALNIALQAATASGDDLVVRFDAHTVYPKDYVKRAAARLARGDVVSVSGPQLAVPGPTSWSRVSAVALRTRLGIGDADFRRPGRTEFEVDSGFCGIWRRADLEAAGGWDEETYPNEDAELAARLRKGGGRIVCVPELAAEYSPRDSATGTARQYHRYGIFRAKTAGRHPESLRLSHLVPPALVLALASNLMPWRPVRRAAHAATALYGAALAATVTAERRELGISTPLMAGALATMHVAWGAGFLRGCARFGVPVRGIVAVARRSGTHAIEGVEA